MNVSKWTVRETSGKNPHTLIYELLLDGEREDAVGQPYGFMDVRESAGRFEGMKLWMGGARIEVHPDFRRQGLATRIYAAAYEGATKRGAFFASVTREPDSVLDRFWAKQVNAKTARCYPRAGGSDVYVLIAPPVLQVES